LTLVVDHGAAPEHPRRAGAVAAGHAPATGLLADTMLPSGAGETAFTVRLDVFSGPFDVLLQLVARHRLDITDVALATVTDEFIAYIRAREHDWSLDRASGFLVVAATLLDLKAARLLPAPDDAEEVALAEARDLLFARLLQYRAFCDVAAELDGRLQAGAQRLPRTVPLDAHLATLLPELVLRTTADQLARLAAGALSRRPRTGVGTGHLHAPQVSVPEQSDLLAARLRGDAPSVPVVVARFLAVLEMFRDGLLTVDQPEPLGTLMLRWAAPAPLGSGWPVVPA
jgi:segregation and condensation protein A